MSQPFYWLFLAWFWIIPILNGCYWFLYNSLPPLAMAHTRMGLSVANLPTFEIRLMALVATMLPASVTMATAWTLRSVFKFYGEGQIFAAATIGCYRRLGWLFIAAAPAKAIAHSALSVLLTISNPPGRKSFAVALGSDEIFSILTGGIILVLAFVMQEASRLEEEQQLTI